MREKLQMAVAAAVLALIALGAAPPAPAAQHQTLEKTQMAMAAMMARGMAGNEEIARLTAEMNKATGDARIDAMARLLTALATQHTMMMRYMQMMHDDATGHASAPGEAPHAAH